MQIASDHFHLTYESVTERAFEAMVDTNHTTMPFPTTPPLSKRPMDSGTPEGLYLGKVMHRRLRPMQHRFVYRVFSVLLDLDNLESLDRRLRLFRVNGWSLFSFLERDHGPRDGTPLRPWIDGKLSEAGIDLRGGTIKLHCFPRILGYAFNPLTIWYCYDSDQCLRAILYEVHNTFGEHHCYLFPLNPQTHAVSDGDKEPKNTVLRHACDKGFYVSPFIPMNARYQFRIREPKEDLLIAIHETLDNESLLVATHTATRKPLTDRTLLSALLRHPLMMIKVMMGIHWEALKLFIKGATFHRRPTPPPELVTFQHQPMVTQSQS